MKAIHLSAVDVKVATNACDGSAGSTAPPAVEWSAEGLDGEGCIYIAKQTYRGEPVARRRRSYGVDCKPVRPQHDRDAVKTYSRFLPNMTRQDGSAVDRLLSTRFGSGQITVPGAAPSLPMPGAGDATPPTAQPPPVSVEQAVPLH